MLKGIDPMLGPELLYEIAKMGHGDELVLADRNYPEYAAGAPVVRYDGHDDVTVVKALLTLFPLDTFTDAPVMHMAGPDLNELLDVHKDVYDACSAADGRTIPPSPIERFAFYERATKAKLVIATTEDRPYGCFVFVKGVV